MPKKHDGNNNFQFGEMIPGTDLRTRWQDGKEISPAYVGKLTGGESVDEMIRQAERACYKSVWDGRSTYVQIGGEWCVWYHPQFNRREEC